MAGNKVRWSGVAPKGSALHLLSGGMDSTIAFYHYLYVRRELGFKGNNYILCLNYGQRNSIEIMHSRKIWELARHQGLFDHGQTQFYTAECAAFPRVGSLVGSAELNTYKKEPTFDEARSDRAFVPARNAVFLSLAASWAAALDCENVVTGIRGSFPDSTAAFVEEMNKVLLTALSGRELVIHSQLASMVRSETILLASTMPDCWEALHLTWSCYADGREPCGVCMACTQRAAAFAEAGIDDPAAGGLR